MPELSLTTSNESGKEKKRTKRPAFPTNVIGQIGAIKRMLAGEPLAPGDLAARFSGAKLDIVRRHLDTLLIMGEVQENPDGRFQRPG